METTARNERKHTVCLVGKSVSIRYVMKYGVINHQQFFVEIYLTLFVDGAEIYRHRILNYRLAAADGACPIDFVAARMYVFDNEKKKTPVAD